MDRRERIGRWVKLVLGSVAAVLTIAVLWQGVTLAMTPSPADGLTLANNAGSGNASSSNAQNSADDQDGNANNEKKKPEPPEHYARLVKRVQQQQLFQRPERESFNARLTGVLGDEAIFRGGNTAGVGDRIDGAEVLEVGADWVRVEWQGEERRLWVFGEREPEDEDEADDDDGPQRERPSRASRRPEPEHEASPEPSQRRPRGPRGGFDRQLPPEVIERIKQRFEQLSPERQQQALERMPEGLKEQLDLE